MAQTKMRETQRPKATFRLSRDQTNGGGVSLAARRKAGRRCEGKKEAHVVVQSMAATAPMKTAMPTDQRTVCHHIRSRNGGEAAYLRRVGDDECELLENASKKKRPQRAPAHLA